MKKITDQLYRTIIGFICIGFAFTTIYSFFVYIPGQGIFNATWDFCEQTARYNFTSDCVEILLFIFGLCALMWFILWCATLGFFLVLDHVHNQKIPLIIINVMVALVYLRVD